jgi:hypothetical protein
MWLGPAAVAFELPRFPHFACSNRYGTTTGASLTNDGAKSLGLHAVPPVLNHMAAARCQGNAYLIRSSLPVAMISPLSGSVARQYGVAGVVVSQA